MLAVTNFIHATNKHRYKKIVRFQNSCYVSNIYQIKHKYNFIGLSIIRYPECSVTSQFSVKTVSLWSFAFFFPFYFNRFIIIFCDCAYFMIKLREVSSIIFVESLIASGPLSSSVTLLVVTIERNMIILILSSSSVGNKALFSVKVLSKFLILCLYFYLPSCYLTL